MPLMGLKRILMHCRRKRIELSCVKEDYKT